MYLTILLAMILIVFGVLGRQLMQGDFVAYGAPDVCCSIAVHCLNSQNRTNWDTTWMAIVSTFGIMTADNWTNTMLAGSDFLPRLTSFLIFFRHEIHRHLHVCVLYQRLVYWPIYLPDCLHWHSPFAIR